MSRFLVWRSWIPCARCLPSGESRSVKTRANSPSVPSLVAVRVQPGGLLAAVLARLVDERPVVRCRERAETVALRVGHLLGDRERVAGRPDGLGVERLGHQAPVPQEEQEPRRRVDRIAVGGNEEAVLLAVQRSDVDAVGVLGGGERVPGEVQEAAAVGEEVRPPVARLLAVRVDLGERHGGAARRLHLVEALLNVGGEDDHTVRTPAPAAARRGGAHRLRRAAAGVDLLELRAGKVRHEAAVRRPEGKRRVVRALERLRGERVERTHPEQLSAGGIGCGEHHPGAVGRQHRAAGGRVEVERGLRGRQEVRPERVRPHRRRLAVGDAEAGGGEQGEGRHDPRHDTAPHRGPGRSDRRRCGRARTFVPAPALLELEADVADVAVAPLRVLLHAAAQHLASARRHAGRQCAPIRLARHHGGDHVGDGVAAESLSPREHLVQQAAERPDVGTPVDRLAACLLRRHVGGGAEDHAFAGVVRGDRRRQRRVRAGAVGLPRLGEAEVEHFDGALGSDLDVGGLEVAVDDALLVRRLERRGDLERDGERLVGRDRAAREPLREVLALDQLHHKRMSFADVLEAVERRDVRVVERRQHLGLALETGVALGVGVEVLGQQLESHLAAEPRVGRAPHLAHPAGAEGAHHLVGPYLRTRFHAGSPVRSRCGWPRWRLTAKRDTVSSPFRGRRREPRHSRSVATMNAATSALNCRSEGSWMYIMWPAS